MMDPLANLTETPDEIEFTTNEVFAGMKVVNEEISDYLGRKWTAERSCFFRRDSESYRHLVERLRLLYARFQWFYDELPKRLSFLSP